MDRWPTLFRALISCFAARLAHGGDGDHRA